jgi:hypothetical protein
MDRVMPARSHADTATISLAAAARMLGGEVRKGQVLCPGPGHSPNDRSLSVKFSAHAPEGFVVKSFSTDSFDDCRDYVRKKLGLPAAKGEARMSQVESYLYEDRFGLPQYETVRYNFKFLDGTLDLDGGKPRKEFRARRRGDSGEWIYKVKGFIDPVPYKLPQLLTAIHDGKRIFLVEGERKVNRLRALGREATCNPFGSQWKWTPEFVEHFRGAEIIILPDHDDPGRAWAAKCVSLLTAVAASVNIVSLGLSEEGADVVDWLDAGHTTDELLALVDQPAIPAPTHDAYYEQRVWSMPQIEEVTDAAEINAIRAAIPEAAEQQPAEKSRPEARETPAADPPTPCAIEETLAVFDHWLLLPDPTPIYAVLGTVAANLLPGDPVWTGLIGPPSSAKTEILNSISGLPNVMQAATLTVAGLLSGVPKKQRIGGAKGGLLRQIGDFGMISLKDFGSVLSMHTETRAEVLAALREVYDGAWTRHLGSDGGRSLAWKGKVGLLFGATGVYDSHYSVIGTLGDRFFLCRLAPAGRGQFDRALKHAGAGTIRMRKELAEAVGRLFAGRRPEPRPITDDEIQFIDGVIMLAVRLRGAVERDRHRREIEAVYGPEGTARIGLALERLLAGLDTLGVERRRALSVVKAVAMDSVPPIRRRAYEYLHALRGNGREVADLNAVAGALALPSITVRRVLEDLTAYGLIERRAHGQGKAHLWAVRDWEDEL